MGGMSGKLKAIFGALILLLIILTVVPVFLPDIQTAADAVADNASYPVLVRMMFGLWWVPIALIMVAVILSANKGAGKRFRRRR